MPHHVGPAINPFATFALFLKGVGHCSFPLCSSTRLPQPFAGVFFFFSTRSTETGVMVLHMVLPDRQPFLFFGFRGSGIPPAGLGFFQSEPLHGGLVLQVAFFFQPDQSGCPWSLFLLIVAIAFRVFFERRVFK